MNNVFSILRIFKNPIFMLGFFIYCCVQNVGLAQSTSPSLSIPDSMVATISSSLRGAEGELLFFIGEERIPLAPTYWQNPSAGVTSFSMQEKACLYHVELHQSTIGDATHALTVGTANVRVENAADVEMDATLWLAWRHFPVDEYSLIGMQGVLLNSAKNAAIDTVSDLTSWNQHWTWFFSGDVFARDTKLLYKVFSSQEWIEHVWVRLPEQRYQEFSPSTTLGYRRFQCTLPGKEKTTLKIIVPFRPLPLVEQERLASVP